MDSQAREALLDNLISACIPVDINNKHEVKDCMENFDILSQFVKEESLDGIRYLMYFIMNRVHKNKTSLNQQVLEIIINSNAKKFIRSTKIDLSELTDNQISSLDLADAVKEKMAINYLYNALVERFNFYRTTVFDEGKFRLSLDLYLDDIKKESIKEVLRNSNKIFLEGLQVGHGYLSGTDVLDYLKIEIAKIEAKFDYNEDNGITRMTINSPEDLARLEEANKDMFRFICSYGEELGIIDENLGGIRGTQVIGVAGMPGVGKTRFAGWVIYNAMVRNMRNVYWWSGEQGILELQTILLSLHCFLKYNVMITDQQIKLNEVPTELLPILANAKIDLYTNYGKIHLDSEPMPVEGYESKMKMIYNTEFKYDFAVIDYISLFESDGSLTRGQSLTEREIVKGGMKASKRLAKKQNTAFMILNQLTKEEIQRLLSGKEATTTGGSNSSEFFNTPDANIVLSNTPQLYEASKIKFHNPKVRLGKRFPTFIADIKQGVSYYKYNPDFVDEEED